MQIEIDGLVAECFSCGSSDFVPLWPRPDQRADKLACAACCAEVVYDDLVKTPDAGASGTLGGLLRAR